MATDDRAATARYYDEQPPPFDGNDIAFYVARLPGAHARVLELGCGTGRVLVPLAAHCAYLHGVDLSAAMLAVCQEKLKAPGLGPERARVEPGDIARLELGQRFDLIIAPFRVFQNLLTDEQVGGFFATIRRHLAPGGWAIINSFRPFGPPQEVREWWLSRSDEILRWEKPFGAGRLANYERLAGVHPEKMICYPVLTYRYYEGEALKDEAVLKIAMRAYYPDELEHVITSYGFHVLEKWGGYAGEVYGEGPELVVEFAATRPPHTPAPDR